MAKDVQKPIVEGFQRLIDGLFRASGQMRGNPPAALLELTLI
jgi:hypothetical protein